MRRGALGYSTIVDHVAYRLSSSTWNYSSLWQKWSHPYSSTSL